MTVHLSLNPQTVGDTFAEVYIYILIIKLTIVTVASFMIYVLKIYKLLKILKFLGSLLQYLSSTGNKIAKPKATARRATPPQTCTFPAVDSQVRLVLS